MTATAHYPQMMYGKSHWLILGQSVRGASHIRDDIPNQDALLWFPQNAQGFPPLILAVSDGHGSSKCFRSAKGASLAVNIAIKSLQELLAGQPNLKQYSAVKRMAEERLPREIVKQWQQVVQQDLQIHPFTSKEKEQIQISDWHMVTNNPLLAYGATLLCVLLTEHFIIYLQLGDGDILVVTHDGGVSRPIPDDEKLFANQTTSLCTLDAWRECRVIFQLYEGISPPSLIMLSTDGYSNSFRDDAGFLQVGSDILDLLNNEGKNAVLKYLPEWLNEASQLGSGDDITMALLYRDMSTAHG